MTYLNEYPYSTDPGGERIKLNKSFFLIPLLASPIIGFLAIICGVLSRFLNPIINSIMVLFVLASFLCVVIVTSIFN